MISPIFKEKGVVARNSAATPFNFDETINEQIEKCTKIIVESSFCEVKSGL